MPLVSCIRSPVPVIQLQQFNRRRSDDGAYIVSYNEVALSKYEVSHTTID